MKQGKFVAIVIVFVMSMVTQKLMAVYPLTHTFSIDTETLYQIRRAAGTISGEPYDNLIHKYWEQPPRSDIVDIGDGIRDRSYTDSFGFEGKAIDAYIAVVDYNNPLIDYSLVLDGVRNYLYTFPWDIYQNALRYQDYYPSGLPGMVPTEWDANPQSHNPYQDEAWWELTAYQRARELSYNLILISFIVDMLYYAYNDPSTTEYFQVHNPVHGIIKKIQLHVDWIHSSFFRYNLPDVDDSWSMVGVPSYPFGWNYEDKYNNDVIIAAPKGLCSDNYINGELPSIGNSVSRFHLVCGMGYASLLTGDDDMLNSFVRQEFKSDSPLPAETAYYGFNDYLTSNSGMFVGGITYQNRLFYLSTLFLTALNRTRDINLYNSDNDWNCDMIPRMIRYTLRRIDPELHHITYGDDWRYNGINSNGDPVPEMDHSIQIERGLLCFYYQTEDQDTQDNIRWYVAALTSKAGSLPREAFEWDTLKSSFEVVMSYKDPTQQGPVSITTGASLPGFILDGTLSDSESTIFRKPTSLSQYENSHMLVVNHENSFLPFHNNNDSTSYQFYLWGKPLIIEPGYTPNDSNGNMIYPNWYKSSYSQNLLLINPELPFNQNTKSEADYLRENSGSIRYQDPMNFDHWPASWLHINQATKPYHTKARKHFLISNCENNTGELIELLKISYLYNNSLKQSPNNFNPASFDNDDNPCNVTRKFYSISSDYFLVKDHVSFDSPQIHTTEYRNQIFMMENYLDHYNYSFSTNQLPGVTKCYSSTMGQGLFVAMGSTLNQVFDPTKDLANIGHLAWTPWDHYNVGSNPIGSMKRISQTAFSARSKENFITLLYPSDASMNPNPITEAIKDANGYRVSLSEGSRKIYIAVCSDSSLDFSIESCRFETDGDFFVMDSVYDFSNLHQMVLSNGSQIRVEPLTGYAFNEQDLFVNFSDSAEEVLATWSDSSLNVTFKTNQARYPIYKIKRCEVLPAQFYSKTEYGSEAIDLADSTSCSRGTIQDNIKSLAYDDQYFYVNYSWEDLTTAGLITEDLVIYKAIIPEVTISTDLNIQGSVIVAGNLSIEHHSSLEIRSGSTVSFAEGAGIINSGTLLIDGGDTHSITLGQEGCSWAGIQSYWGSTTNCSNAIIKGAEIGLYIRGTADITNNLIRDCSIGLKIESLQPFKVEYNEFTDNEYGAQIINTIGTSQNIFRDNEVWQNITGLSLYNSNIALQSNNIHHNLSCGIFLSRGSEPLIKGSNISNTECGGLAHPEIQMIRDSYPVIDDTCNDINADGIGQSLYFSNEPGEKIKPLSARNNYWGFTNSLDIQASIYPDNWFVDFEPYNVSPNTAFSPVLDNPLMQAVVAEEDGDIGLAKQLYYNIIDSEPDSLYALQSLGRLNSLYAASPSLFSDLRAKYSDYLSSCSDSLLIDIAQAKLPMLDRFDFQFAQAIQSYEDLLLDSNCEIDSILCLLDIAYTLQDMYYHDQTKGTNTATYYNSNGLQIGTLKEAKNTINRLWDLLIDNTAVAESAIAPVPTKLDLMNYPNPFNPSTTIVFGLPDGGEVRMSIYNIRGQLVRNLQNGYLPRGFHKIVWDGMDERNRPVSSGLYFIRIDSANSRAIKKVMLLK
jgi:hypothetical protein